MPKAPYRPPVYLNKIFRGSSAIQRGVLARDELRSAAWRPLFRDVYADACLGRDHKILCLAVSGYVMPQGAAIAGRSAAYLYGVALIGRDDPVEVIAPRAFGPVKGVSIHTGQISDVDLLVKGSLAITRPLRTCCMGSILNGIVLHGGTRPYGGTFLIFSDYMRPAVRLAALMKLPVIYVWTHDSIGLGEDGPTHQPVEHLAALRAIPGLDVVRPADANETAHAWRMALTHTDRPTALCLTRQNLPTMEPGSIKDFEKGGYILADATDGSPEVIIIATGSEVNVALTARERLQEQGHRVRVVSMPCREWFDRQEEGYRQKVLPPSVKARVSVEAGVAMPWKDLVGPYGQCVSLEHFGASAPYQVLFEQFGFTPDNVVAAAHASLSRTAQIKGETTGN